MHSHDTLNPTGGVAMGHVVESLNPDENLLERILSLENMQQARKRVKANKGAAGIDGMSIEAFPAYACDHWDEIRDALNAGTYQPSPVRRVEIPKAAGGTYRSSHLSRFYLPGGQHPLDRRSLPRIQASCEGAYGPKLVCFHGLPVPEACTVSPRLGELLRDL